MPVTVARKSVALYNMDVIPLELKGISRYFILELQGNYIYI